MNWLGILGKKDSSPNQVNLIQQENKRSYDIFKNRLFLTSLLNLLIFLLFIFAMCFYQWALVQIPLYEIKQEAAQQYIQKTEFQFYGNLLYGKTMEKDYYQSYYTIEEQICVINDILCQSTFNQLAFVGYLSFTILTLGAVFQIYDIYRMFLHFYSNETGFDFRQEKRDNLRHIITIGHFLIGITLNLFGFSQMEVQIKLGASFWSFVGGLFGFIVIIVYEQISLNKLRKQKLILGIMKAEREINQNISATVEMSSQGDFSI